MHRWIILDKPSGITSAHAVAKVKRLLKPQKIGHAGTLDPLASGVLPLALGEATKTVAYMMDAAKAYEFTVTWGQERDTDDSEGKITHTSEKRPAKAEILALLPQFIGKIQQTPPAFSAIKVGGKRSYDLARSGEGVELKAREVRVDSLHLSSSGLTRGSIVKDYAAPTALAMDPRLRGDDSFVCHCGKGVYIRSLARDMGRELGCFGYVSRLRRIKVGKFDQTHAISLEMLEEMVHKGDLGFLMPVESALDDILAIDITDDQAIRLQRGQNVVLPLNAECSTMIARSGGKLIAICEWKESRLKPVRVFNL